MSALTYTSYLRIDELLALQTCQSPGPEHDETLFIIIHQVYELWFKQMLHEGQMLKRTLRQGDVPRAMHALRRMGTILKTMVSQVDILETMTPLSFNSFRDSLATSSGFQSQQFRHFEAMLGKRSRAMRAAVAGSAKAPAQSAADAAANGPAKNAGASERAAMERAMGEASVYDAFLALAHKRGYTVPEAVLCRDVTEEYAGDTDVQNVMIAIYRNDPELAQICERLVDLDEGLQEWRYRHVKMVERTIGVKMGTGGSPGVEYLKKTLFTPLFPDLWNIRAAL